MPPSPTENAPKTQQELETLLKDDVMVKVAGTLQLLLSSSWPPRGSADTRRRYRR